MEQLLSAIQILYRTIRFTYLKIRVVRCLDFNVKILLGLHAPSPLYGLQLMLLYGSDKCCTTALGYVQNFSLKFVFSLSNFVPSLPQNSCNLRVIRANFKLRNLQTLSSTNSEILLLSILFAFALHSCVLPSPSTCF